MRLHPLRNKDGAPARNALHKPVLSEMRRPNDAGLAGPRSNTLQTHILNPEQTEKGKSGSPGRYYWPEGL